MGNPLARYHGLGSCADGTGVFSPNRASMAPRFLALSGSLVWIGLLVLFACNVGRAQGADGTAGVFCNKNNTNSTIATELSLMGACSTTNPAAVKAATQWNTIQNNLQRNQQSVGNAISAGFQIWSLFHPAKDTGGAGADPDGEQPDPEAEAAAAAAEQQRINVEAANLFQVSNSLAASLDGTGADTTPEPSATSAVDALLDSGDTSNTSTAAVSALLGDTTPADTSANATANAVAGLLDESKVSDSASAFPPGAQPGTSMQAPDDPQFNAVFQESADQPSQVQSGALEQMLQSTGQRAKDALSGLVTSGRSLVSSLTNDRTVQWLVSDQSSFTTAPLPVSSDSPDTVGNLASGQAIVGFGDILKGFSAGPWGGAKGLYSYGTKMINQMGADLGFANSNILNDQSGN
jgi:hypothetical protein